MKFTIFQNSRQGPRPHNQDRLAYSYSKDALLLVLADGMGGHRHGEMAAQLAVKTLTDAFQRLALPTLPSPAKFLTDHIQQVHDMIEQLTQSESLIDSPRTTIVAAVVQRGYLYCAHVGDSRLYHFRDGHLLFRTEDHSVVQAMFKKGMISREEMKAHPYRNKVYNCLGGDVQPQIDLSNRHELAEGDTLLLCTDGVWGVVEDSLIKDILMENDDISKAIGSLLNQAEYSGDEKVGDNMSAIGVQWGDRVAGLGAISTQMMPLDETTTIINEVTSEPAKNEAGDLSDRDIESTIAEIQAALNRTQKKMGL